MSETGFMLLQSIESGMEIILYAVCMTAFFYPFMTEETEWRTVKLRKSFMVFLVHVSIYLIGMAASVYSWLCMVIVIILLVAASQFIGVDKKFTFFLSILFFSVQNISSLILESMYYVFLMTFSDDIMEINSI